MNNINNCFDCVVYHSPCPDGTCAAWIVKKFHDDFNKEIELFPCRAGCVPDKEIEYFMDKTIVFVDICPNVSYLEKLSTIAKYIQIIDHHKSSQENISEIKLQKNVSCVFDMEFSGCQLTWKYFYSNDALWFVDYIGDRDIWKFALPNTNEYFSGIIEENLMNLEGFQKLYDNLENEEFKLNILNVGKKALEFREKCIQNVLKYNKMQCTYKEYNIWLYSATKDLTSDVGNRLMKYKFKDESLPDFTVGWIYDVENDEFWISMRSTDEKQDVSKICKELGGGGHRNASGCTVKGKLKDLFIPVKTD
jgi:oligoribonuclease NrnB/cAMP/cGMP phosphodiesterase (DHH superfamily)